MIYLDNAATTFPKPDIVYREMDIFYRSAGANPGRAGYTIAISAEKKIEETRSIIAQFFGVKDPNRLILTFNATDAINMGIKGLLKPGDHVITTHLEHNAVARVLSGLEKRRGVLVSRVDNSSDGFIDPHDIKQMVTSKTRLIVMSHATNVLGTIQDIEEAGRIARENELFFMVDAAQSAGVCDIDVTRFFIDMLAFTGHKGLFGPTGTGGLYVGERINLDPWREGGTGAISDETSQPELLPYKLESGTPNVSGIAGLQAGVEYVLAKTRKEISTHEKRLADKLVHVLVHDERFIVYGSKNRANTVSIVSINLKGYKPTEVCAILDQSFSVAVRPGLHCAPGTHKKMGTFPEGTLRISPGFFNTEEDIDCLISALNKIANETI
ncbi:MAG: aminotransferase class V-fold PLP-dependent enzyme [Candidatus Brocadiaceae bacterium]|nr:aminotransferase class V-fold PLP-dependent enzyme [Candidatus Brocadiaceae bacterium]